MIKKWMLAALLIAPMAWAQGTFQGNGGGGGSGTVTSLTFTSPLTGGTITTSGTVGVVLSAVNPQTGTYQVLASDFSNYKTITVASGTFTITLVASGSQPANGQYIDIVNYGSGVVTIARSGQNINGGTSSLTLGAASATAPQSTTIISDGTNYFATGIAGNGGVASVQFDANPALTGAIQFTSGTGINTSQSSNTVTVSTNNATSSVQGTIVLTQDLGGSATAPQVVGVNGVGIQRVTMTADWTCGTGGTVTTCTAGTIIGASGTPLTITLPNVTASYHWQCDGVVGQATAAVANTWSFLTASHAPTNMEATYMMNAGPTAIVGGATTGVSSTSSTAIGGTWTLSSTGTKMPFHLQGSIESASSSGTVVSAFLTSASNADLITIYRGATCSVTPF